MNLLQSSVTTGILIGIIIVLRAVTKNILPKSTFRFLWGVALIKLFLPVPVPSSFSIYNLVLNAGTPAAASSISNPSIADAIDMMAMKLIAADGKPVIWPMFIIWLAGALSLGVFFAVTFMKYKRQIRTALPIRCNRGINNWLGALQLYRRIRVLTCDHLTTPIACGVFKPKIILPSFMDLEDAEQLEYILTHELVHIKRFDAIWRFLLIAALCVYWFNPAVWLMYIFVCRDLELSCDEKVVRLLGESSKTGYARSMIYMAERRRRHEPIYNGFMKNSAEERIISIMKYKKISHVAVLAAGLLIFGVIGAFGTSANVMDGAESRGFPDKSAVSEKNVSSDNNSNPFIWPDSYISFKKVK